MKKSLLFIAFISLINTSMFGQGMEFFHGTFEEAQAKAKEENKKIFIDFYTKWCGPCKLMANTVFTQPEVGAYYNPRFINIKINGAEGSGVELATKYNVRSYPSYIYLNADGTEIFRYDVGAMPAEQFIKFTKVQLEGTQSNYAELAKRYEQGERDPDFVKAYIKATRLNIALEKSNNKDSDGQSAWMREVERLEKLKVIAKEYIQQLDKESLISPENYEIISFGWHRARRGDEMVEFVLDNYDAFIEQQVPEGAIADFVLEANYGAAYGRAMDGDITYKKYLAEYDGRFKSTIEYYFKSEENLPEPDLESFKRSFDIMYMKAKEDWKGAYRIYKKELKKRPENAQLFMEAANVVMKINPDKNKDKAWSYLQQIEVLGFEGAYFFGSYYKFLKERLGKEKEAENSLNKYHTKLLNSTNPADKKSLEELKWIGLI